MPGKTHTVFDLAGSLAILVTVLSFISTPLIIRFLTGHLDSWSQNAFRYGAAMLFGRPLTAFQIPLSAWAALAASGILGFALGHVFYFVAIKRIGTVISSMVMLVTPFGVYALSSQFFGEQLQAMQWIAGVVLLIGAAVVMLSQQKRS